MSSSDMSINQSYSPPIVERPVPGDLPTVKKINSVDLPKNNPTLNENEMKSSAELRRAEQHGDILPLSDEQVMRAIERAIKAAEGITTSLQFSVHKATHQISVKVMDKETGEVIREIPPEKNLDFLATLWRKAGILIDEKR